MARAEQATVRPPPRPGPPVAAAGSYAAPVRPILAPATPVAVRTVPLDTVPDLLALLPDQRPVAWVRDGDGLVGWGEAARFAGQGTERFTDADAQWREWLAGVQIDDQAGQPGSGPVAFGAFAFSPDSAGSTLVVPRVVVGRRAGRAWLTTVGSPSATLGPVPAALPAEGLRYSDGVQPSTQWTATVATAVRRIRAGELGKVVLARDVLATAERPIDPRFLLGRLAARYGRDCWTFACDGILGATPELLVRRTGDVVASRVLAGTIGRGRDDAEDAELARRLIASAKDREEHEYAARSMRDGLARHCTDIQVPAEPALLSLANLMHLASDVRARVADGASALEIAGSLHPTAAVCGTPTDAAMRAIEQLEQLDRRRYAGPVGWVDARGDGEWGVALRCAEVSGRQARMYAGCGIVADSDPNCELAESQVKFAPMRDALEGV